MLFSQSDIDNLSISAVDVITPTKPVCKKCGLHLKCNSPKMGVAGEGKLKILIIAEVPSYEEDLNGVLLSGNSNKYLREIIKEQGYDLDRDFWKINAVNCKPTDKNKNSRSPKDTEIQYCRPMVMNAIAELKPINIWLLGNASLKSLYGGKFSRLTMNRWRGYRIPDKDTGAYVYPMFHPSHVIRKNDNELTMVFENDIKEALKWINIAPKTHLNYESMVNTITDYHEILSVLEDVLEHKPEILYIDYETTGIKPYRPGNTIATIAFTTGDYMTYAFPLHYNNMFGFDQVNNIQSLWNEILCDKAIGKAAHNMKFEHVWAQEILGQKTKPWVFDTMIAAHILDNRASITGLKFQTYVNLGILPYDTLIKPYLQSQTKDGLNNIHKAPLKELLLYNGLDTLFGMYLLDKQEEEMDNEDRDCVSFFLDGIEVFAEMEKIGINVDEEYYNKQGVILTKEIQKRKVDLENHPSAVQFFKVYNKRIDIASNKDLGKLFFDIEGNEPQLTDNGNKKVDKGALEKLDSKFANKLLKYRKLIKIRDTYLAQFKRNITNNKLHPSFDLHIPTTFRSSSSNPNFYLMEVVKDIELLEYPKDNSATTWSVMTSVNCLKNYCMILISLVYYVYLLNNIIYQRGMKWTISS